MPKCQRNQPISWPIFDRLWMLYYKARFYNPALGRFMQTDPIGYEDDNNLYAYVGNDPLNNVDPTGEYKILWEILKRLFVKPKPPVPKPSAPKPGPKTKPDADKPSERPTESNKPPKSDNPSKPEREKAKDRCERQQAEDNKRRHGDEHYEEPAPESYAKWKARELDKLKGKDSRRDAHDKKGTVEEIGRDRSLTKTMIRNEEDSRDAIAALCDSGKFDAAIEALEREIAIAPLNAKLWARMGWCKFSKTDFQGAIPDFTRALELRPGGATTLYFRARCWEEIGELAKAVADYSESLRIKPKADAFIARGLVHKYLNRITDATSDFESALQLEPDNEVAASLLR